MPKHTFAKMTMTARTALAVGVTLIFALLCCLAFTLAAMASEDPTAHLSLYGEIAFALSLLFCGFFGAKIAADQRFTAGLLAAGVLLLAVIAASVAFGGSNFVKEVLLALLGCFMGALGALLGAKEPRRRRKR